MTAVDQKDVIGTIDIQPEPIANLIPLDAQNDLQPGITGPLPPWNIDLPEWNALVIAREYFPQASDQELDGIIWGETGYPAFWSIPAQGRTYLECFRRQLLQAVARRELHYSNLEIIEQDPYIGTVGKLKVTNNGNWAEMEAIEIELPDGASVRVTANREVVVQNGGTTLHQRLLPPPRAWNPFLGTSDHLSKFVDEMAAKGKTQDDIMKIPLGIIVNWLVMKAAEADG